MAPNDSHQTGETHTDLYGTNPETLFSTEAEAAADFARWLDPGEVRRVEVVRYSAHPPAYHMPAADLVLDFVMEHAADGEVDEWWCESAERAFATDAASDLSTAFLSSLAELIPYRMADKELGSSVVEVSGPPIPCCHGCADSSDGSHQARRARSFITCPECGSKECPRATAHVNSCGAY